MSESESFISVPLADHEVETVHVQQPESNDVILDQPMKNRLQLKRTYQESNLLQNTSIMTSSTVDTMTSQPKLRLTQQSLNVVTSAVPMMSSLQTDMTSSPQVLQQQQQSLATLSVVDSTGQQTLQPLALNFGAGQTLPLLSSGTNSGLWLATGQGIVQVDNQSPSLLQGHQQGQILQPNLTQQGVLQLGQGQAQAVFQTAQGQLQQQQQQQNLGQSFEISGVSDQRGIVMEERGEKTGTTIRQMLKQGGNHGNQGGGVTVATSSFPGNQLDAAVSMAIAKAVESVIKQPGDGGIDSTAVNIDQKALLDVPTLRKAFKIRETDGNSLVPKTGTGFSEDEAELEIQLFLAKLHGREPPVKEMRRMIPLLIMACYDIRDEPNQKKVKGLWSEVPNGWPETVPYVDPNNPNRGDGSCESGKPKKDTLQKMWSYLKEEYIKQRDIIEPIDQASVEKKLAAYKAQERDGANSATSDSNFGGNISTNPRSIKNPALKKAENLQQQISRNSDTDKWISQILSRAASDAQQRIASKEGIDNIKSEIARGGNGLEAMIHKPVASLSPQQQQIPLPVAMLNPPSSPLATNQIQLLGAATNIVTSAAPVKNEPLLNNNNNNTAGQIVTASLPIVTPISMVFTQPTPPTPRITPNTPVVTYTGQGAMGGTLLISAPRAPNQATVTIVQSVPGVDTIDSIMGANALLALKNSRLNVAEVKVLSSAPTGVISLPVLSNSLRKEQSILSSTIGAVTTSTKPKEGNNFGNILSFSASRNDIGSPVANIIPTTTSASIITRSAGKSDSITTTSSVKSLTITQQNLLQLPSPSSSHINSGIKNPSPSISATSGGGDDVTAAENDLWDTLPRIEKKLGIISAGNIVEESDTQLLLRAKEMLFSHMEHTSNTQFIAQNTHAHSLESTLDIIRRTLLFPANLKEKWRAFLDTTNALPTTTGNEISNTVSSHLPPEEAFIPSACQRH